MRRYGTIAGVYFSRQGYSIYSLAYEYKLVFNGDAFTVYANNMTELKNEIAKITGYHPNEQKDPLPVPELPSHRQAPT